ncbi:MAG TPA: FHA domain-containing protein [Polyangiaceae bacterium]|nr:FHA domain-containing protein [Polyangiaceae bacterium]
MSIDRSEVGARYRLRFLLQEFDLPFGHTLIGRGNECQITIFDPSISRRHARIIVDGGGAVLEDLGSRNGCRVNGLQVRGRKELVDGNRIRIGRQELVFSEVRIGANFHHRQTGSLCYCGDCRAAYPREVDACPHCGSSVRGPTPAAANDHDEGETTPPTRPRSASAPPTN